MSETGGISKFIIDNYSRINKNKNLKFHFVIDRTETNEQKVFMDKHNMEYTLITPFRKNPFAFFYQWLVFFAKYGRTFDAVHFHWDSLKKFYLIWLAKLSGIKKIIIHSHNSEIPMGIASHVMFSIGKKVVKKCATDRIACAESAARWFFYPDDHVEIIRNGIETNRFKYSQTIREKYRSNLKISLDCCVYIHVGHFGEQKNQTFLIDVFKKIHDKNTNTKLVLVGEGEQIQKIKNKVLNLGLNHDVLFLGKRKDVSNLLSLADIMIFPSKHEGLPFALIEAQASGLPVICSSSIDVGICMLNSTRQIALTKGASYWAGQILSISNNIERQEMAQTVRKLGYDINDTCLNVLGLYFN